MVKCSSICFRFPRAAAAVLSGSLRRGAYYSTTTSYARAAAAGDRHLRLSPVKPLAQAKNLRWLQLSTAGADRYLPPGVLRDRLAFQRDGAYGPAVSEHMLGMLMTCIKRCTFTETTRERRSGKPRQGALDYGKDRSDFWGGGYRKRLCAPCARARRLVRNRD
jgi:hypothetical protein